MGGTGRAARHLQPGRTGHPSPMRWLPDDRKSLRSPRSDHRHVNLSRKRRATHAHDARRHIAMITHAQLKTRFSYNPHSGRFWNLRTKKQAGALKGNQQGYVQIKIDGVAYCRHKLAWFYVTGIYPKHRLAHKDLDTSNDAFGNLRP